MTKKEFLKRMELVKHSMVSSRFGVCYGLLSAFGEFTVSFETSENYNILKEELNELFNDSVFNRAYYLGPLNGNYDTRLTVIDLFTEYCLDSQIYRGL